MKLRKNEVIECPHCGREYLPAEIFISNGFFGKPTFIDRDCYGKIIDFCGTNIDNTETYICDNCNKEFKIIAKLNFTISEKTIDFDEAYSIKLKQDKLKLNED